MENHVINLIVPMYDIAPILHLCAWIFEVGKHFFHMRYRADSFSSFYIVYSCLRLHNSTESFDLSIVETGCSAKLFESNALGVHPVELCQCSNCIMPPILSS